MALTLTLNENLGFTRSLFVILGSLRFSLGCGFWVLGSPLFIVLDSDAGFYRPAFQVVLDGFDSMP